MGRSPKAARRAVQRYFQNKGYDPDVERALDASVEQFWKRQGGGRVCDVPEGFFVALGLACLDQAGFALETQRAVGTLLRGAADDDFEDENENEAEFEAYRARMTERTEVLRG